MKKLFLVILFLLFCTWVFAEGSFVLEPNGDIISGQTQSPTGSATPLSSTSTRVMSITLQPLPQNTGRFIYVGTSTVTTNTGAIIASGSSLTLDIQDLNKVYFTTDYVNDGVSYVATLRGPI